MRSGDGGNGCESHFRRTDKKIVPHGGDGGHGGRVLFRADTSLVDLASFRFKQVLIAESGGHGSSSHKRGKNGRDLTVLVPPGTRIFDRTRSLLVRVLAEAGDEVVVLEGGRGGSGNTRGREATHGEKGASLDVELTLRIPADVFLVGLPNSGKSRLLNSLTRSRVREEHYPFATRVPKIGVFMISDYESVTLCELPSIYRASHEGRGMGADFLKHLEGARCLFYLLDPVSKFCQSLAEGFSILRKELEIFEPAFLKIPYAVIVNKMDLAEARERVKQENFHPEGPVFYLSALTGEGLEGLRGYLESLKSCGKH